MARLVWDERGTFMGSTDLLALTDARPGHTEPRGADAPPAALSLTEAAAVLGVDVERAAQLLSASDCPRVVLWDAPGVHRLAVERKGERAAA